VQPAFAVAPHALDAVGGTANVGGVNAGAVTHLAQLSEQHVLHLFSELEQAGLARHQLRVLRGVDAQHDPGAQRDGLHVAVVVPSVEVDVRLHGPGLYGGGRKTSTLYPTGLRAPPRSAARSASKRELYTFPSLPGPAVYSRVRLLMTYLAPSRSWRSRSSASTRMH